MFVFHWNRNNSIVFEETQVSIWHLTVEYIGFTGSSSTRTVPHLLSFTFCIFSLCVVALCVILNAARVSGLSLRLSPFDQTLWLIITNHLPYRYS